MKIFNIEKFIKEHGCLEVTNAFAFGKEDSLNDDGLYSPRIFGESSREMVEKFGYIKLNATIIHPAMYDMLIKVKSVFKHCFTGDKKYIIVDGELIEDDNGKSGIGWFHQNYNSINFDKYKTNKNEKLVKFLKDKSNVFITKFIVIPRKFREFTTDNGMRHEDEITGLYKKLLGRISSGKSDNEFMKKLLQDSSKDQVIQQSINVIYNHFLDLLKAKEGHFRANLISKRIDNNARLVANARPDIPINCIGVPWHVLLNVFDVFVVGFLRDRDLAEDYLDKLGLKNAHDSDIASHLYSIFQNSDTYTKNEKGKREIWVALLKEMFEYHKELRVTCKRDPAWSKGSYVAGKPVIIPDNAYHVIVNAQVYKPFGGDSFSTDLSAVELDTDVLISNYDYNIIFDKVQVFKKTSNIFRFKEYHGK